MNAHNAALIVDRFEAAVAMTPDAIALTSEHEVSSGFHGQISYARLNDLANGVAHRLRARGVASESVVGVAVDDRCAATVGVLGVMKAGACFLPLEPSLPAARLKRINQDAGIAVIVATQAAAERLGELGARVLCLEECLATAPARPPQRSLLPLNAAYIIYTSGSTGEPKGVATTQQGIANHARAFVDIVGVSPRDTLLQCASMTFDIAYEEMFPALCQGARVVVVDAQASSDIGALLRLCAEQQVTVLAAPTALWHLLTRMLKVGGVTLPCSLRCVLFAGEEASVAHARFWEHRYAGQVKLLNGYGPTEATIVATYGDVLEETLSDDGVPLGKAIPGLSISLHGSRRMRTDGQFGEIHIGGAGVARGYVNSSRLTADRFVPDPDGSGTRAYRTGDLATMTSRGLIFKGRFDNQIKLNGYRIQLEEVEAALLTHPAVSSCAVLLKDDHLGSKRLVAYCVLNAPDRTLPFDPEPLNVTSLRQHLEALIPAYMIPKEYSFLEKFILTANGKIDRAKLPEIGHLDRARRRLPVYSRPRPGVEMQLAKIWSEVLDLEIDDISADDPFEYLGGNSLYVIEMRFRAEQAGLLFEPHDVHQQQTIRNFAQRCVARGGAVSRVRRAAADYSRYGAVEVRSMLLELQRWWRRVRQHESRDRRIVERFYEGLADKRDILYVYFGSNLLHWLTATLSYVPPGHNIVLIGSGLAEEEVRHVAREFDRPFLHLTNSIDMKAMLDILFAVNRENFGWLDVDCLVLNPSIFDEMRRMAPTDAVNSLWTHAACGPTKRPFHVVLPHFLFFNIAAINALRERGVLPRPSDRIPNRRHVGALKALIPQTDRDRNGPGRLMFRHGLFRFTFQSLALYQLIANASGYKLNRVRFLTELDTFNGYNYYSDEVIHVFPTIRFFDPADLASMTAKLHLTADYLLIMSMLDRLPPTYATRARLLENTFERNGLEIETMRAALIKHLGNGGVSDRTFAREDLAWMTRHPTRQPDSAEMLAVSNA